MKHPVLAAIILVALSVAARAETSAVGLYAVDPDGHARVVMPGGTPLKPGDTITVLMPATADATLNRAEVTLGDPAPVSDNDAVTFEAPLAWSVETLTGSDVFGIAIAGLPARAAPDIDANGTPEVAVGCTSSESVQLALTEGEGDALRLVWHLPVYLGYDTEPTCDEAFFAAVERAM